MNIPEQAWSRPFDAFIEDSPSSARPLLEELLGMIPMLIRIFRYERRTLRAGGWPVLFNINHPDIESVMGVPLGGLGGGAITRGWRGDFNRWSLRPGIYSYDTVEANQFALAVRRPGQRTQAVVLNPDECESLSSWEWNLREDRTNYHALYPRAWTEYRNPLPDINVTCRQISPVIPHDYETSSTPAATFVYEVQNTGAAEATVGLMFTWQNGLGTENDSAGGHRNVLFREDDVVGVELQHKLRFPKQNADGSALSDDAEQWEDPLSFAIAAKQTDEVEVSYRTRWVTSGSGMDVWSDFVQDAALENTENDSAAPPRYAIGAAVCATVTVPPGETREVAFSLAWDMPLARFNGGRAWYRRYTRFYGREGDAAPALARDALLNYPDWERRIAEWQDPILADDDLPAWFKGALFNESYFLTDGGTLWTDGRPDEETDPLGEDPDVGHFAYLEGHVYPMYNTYDVHFYASWALAQLWPKLQLSLQRDFAHAVDVEHPEEIKLLASGKTVQRKTKGLVPHDLGAPGEDPWFKINAYNFQDSNRWKDLNPKFVLQVWRDYALTEDDAFLREMWPAVKAAMAYMEQFDLDGDGMIDNEGFPDQTYDTWTAKGPSAYTGGLWVASLRAAARMADIIGEAEAMRSYQATFKQAKEVYDLLYNGDYFDYDASGRRSSTTIMADQLAGHWYAVASHLGGIVDDDRAERALKTVYEYNVNLFENGEIGAVNGMRPDGKVDLTSLQSAEVWTGVTYAVAAAMLQQGLDEQAWATARGIWQGVERFGYWFQTPEAWTHKGNYRSPGYMRPLSIWAIYWAWAQRKGL